MGFCWRLGFLSVTHNSCTCTALLPHYYRTITALFLSLPYRSRMQSKKSPLKGGLEGLKTHPANPMTCRVRKYYCSNLIALFYNYFDFSYTNLVGRSGKDNFRSRTCPCACSAITNSIATSRCCEAISTIFSIICTIRYTC